MTRRSWAGMAALLFAVALPAAAQQPGAPAAPRPQMLNVELALRQKDQLKLTDAQFSQLDAIRKEIVAERQQRAHDMIDVQSRLAAGLIKREDVRKEFESNRAQLQQVAQQRHDRIAKILSTEQQDQLRQAQRRMMMQRMRQRGFGRGPGFGGGFAPGGMGWGRRGPGFAPGFGPGFGPRRPFPPRGPGRDEE